MPFSAYQGTEVKTKISNVIKILQLVSNKQKKQNLNLGLITSRAPDL